MGLHLMEGTPSAQTIIQRRYILPDHPHVIIYELRGVLQFTESEMLLRILQQENFDENDNTPNALILDLTNISLIHAVGCRMLLEGIDRLSDDGFDVVVIDPEAILTEQKTHQGLTVQVFSELESFLSQ